MGWYARRGERKQMEGIDTIALEKKFPVLKFFRYQHLPDVLQRFSKPFADMALEMVRELHDSPHPAEIATGLRKLLEAKDCLVRARLPDSGEPIRKS